MPQSTVIPELPYPDVVLAADWLCSAFGFRVRLWIGDHRAQLEYGDGSVVVVQGSGSVALMVRVDDVDMHYQRVSSLGIRVPRAPGNYPYGERQYTVEDIGGHRWTFSQTIADIDPAEWLPR